MKALIVLFAMLVSCLSVKRTEPESVDSRLQRFVTEFFLECSARRSDCKKALASIESIQVVDKLSDFDPGDEGVIGRCYISLYRKKIEILKEVLWKPDRYIKALVYHEIGHCAYNLDHVRETDELMSEYMPGMPALVFRWEAMLAQFFLEIRQKNGD